MLRSALRNYYLGPSVDRGRDNVKLLFMRGRSEGGRVLPPSDGVEGEVVGGDPVVGVVVGRETRSAVGGGGAGLHAWRVGEGRKGDFQRKLASAELRREQGADSATEMEAADSLTKKLFEGGAVAGPGEGLAEQFSGVAFTGRAFNSSVKGGRNNVTSVSKHKCGAAFAEKVETVWPSGGSGLSSGGVCRNIGTPPSRSRHTRGEEGGKGGQPGEGQDPGEGRERCRRQVEG